MFVAFNRLKKHETVGMTKHSNQPMQKKNESPNQNGWLKCFY